MVRVLEAVNLDGFLFAFKFPVSAVQKIYKLVSSVAATLHIFARFSANNFGQLAIEIFEGVAC